MADAPSAFDQLLESTRPKAQAGGNSFDTLLRATAPDSSREDLTRSAVLTAHEQLMRNAGLPPLDENSLAMGLRQGVPMNMEDGVSAGERRDLGFDVNRFNQLKLLIQKHGNDVDLAPDGNNFILRNQVNPQTGLTEDVMVNPPGLEAGDISEMSAQILPMAAGALAARAGLRVPMGPIVKTIAGAAYAALGQRAAEGALQTTTRLWRGDPVNLPEITRERFKNAEEDFVLGLAMAGTGAGLRAVSPFSNISPAIRKANQARSRLNEQLFSELPETPGLRTGSPFLLRGEATARRVPGSAGVFDAITAKEQAAVDELRRIGLGLPRQLTDEQLLATLPQADVVGQKALGRLGSEALKAEGAVESSRQALAKTGTTEAKYLLGAGSTPVETAVVGKDLISRVRSDWDTFKSYWGDRYDQFFDKPETVELDVPARSLSGMARTLRSSFTPLVKKEKEVATGLLDEFGIPLTARKTVIEGLDKFVQNRVLTSLDELASMGVGETSIRSLKQIRTNIDDAIAQNVAIPGTDTGQLKRIRSVLTDTISDALAAKDPALLKEWQELNKGWSQGMKRFDFNRIRDILIPSGQPGSPGETEVAERVLGKSAAANDAWTAYKNFFGSGSVEMKTLQQTVRSKIFEDSLDNARGYVNGQTLNHSLENLRPEIARDVFGQGVRQQLSEVADALATGQGKLDAGEALQLASSGTFTARALLELQSAETARASTYKNALIKAASKGALNTEAVQPSEFVRYMTNGKLKLDSGDIRLVRSVIDQDPQLSQQITQLAVEDFFDQAGLAGLNRSRVTFSSQIDKTLGDPEQIRRWEALLGKKTVDNLKDLSESLRPGSVAAEAFTSAGSMSGGSIVANIMAGKFEGVPGIIRRRVVAGLYAFPPVRNMLANNLMSGPTTMRAINTLVTSEPFVTETLRRFGPEAGKTYMQDVRSFLDQLYETFTAAEHNEQMSDPRLLAP